MTLRFKLDENMPDEAAALMRDGGHDVRGALEQQLGGRPDELLSSACRSEARVLVTLDLDFADIRAYPPADYPGIWVLRPSLQSIDSVLALLSAALALTTTEQAAQRLWIIEPGQVRIRQ